MSLRDELALWAAARDAFSAQNYTMTLQLFRRMQQTAMIMTNMGLLYAGMGEHEKALRPFTDATARDSYLSISYFQRGVSHFLLERYRPASRDFKRAWLSLRGNEEIAYGPLGLSFNLFASEVLFNLGLSRIRMDQIDKGMEYLTKAKVLTLTEDHYVIEEAIQSNGEGYTVFSIPPGVLYWPPETKLMSVKRKEFIPKAILIAATDPDDLGTDFSGPRQLLRHQRNLNRQSTAILARRVTLVSIPHLIFAIPPSELIPGSNAPITAPYVTDLDPLPSGRRSLDENSAYEAMRLP
ncbi:hypothetical protein B0H16DRAFT_1560313 [Mycena metata]|uniref:Uncharacterized protein n=1 Tax=Mycena metata TaxID=1033252 RepID=A0AAD7N3N3_9AGAR|nr:hypothetical protein B0H16DRAFT_1560313 [Mycena metata]